jgi:CHAD domain-containing protein
MVTHENTLSERERFVLTALASDVDPTTARRARALLDWSKGESRETIAHDTGMRPAQVQFLTRAFSQKRLEVFSPSSVVRAGRGSGGCVTIAQILEKHKTDTEHARFVTTLATTIFDQTAHVHQLGPEWRNVLETGALLHNIGATEHDDRQHQAGRNIILAHRLDGISDRDRDIVACLALFQRKKPNASRDPIFTSLDSEAQKSTLALAAILRVADGLDSSQTQSTSLASIVVNAIIDVVVEGPHAVTDATRANKRADLWREVLSPPITFRLAGQAAHAAVPRSRPRLKTDITSHESITRAGRKIISAQFAKVRALEDTVREGDNVEVVHDIRVATRRMRSAFRLLSKHYPNKRVRKLRKPLRVLASCLGHLRDLDVLIENLRFYSATLTIEQQRALDPLMADWQARRARGHRALVDLLDGSGYDEWVARVEDFIEAKDSTDAPRVGDVVPALIWKQYGKLREYERHVKQPTLPILHALRIEDKRLRYTLEFFSEALGDKTGGLVQPLIALQDHLGELHDADMAAQLIAEFIAGRARDARRQAFVGTDFEAVASYLSFLQSRIGELQAGFPERWQTVVKPAFRQTLSEVVAEL